MKSTKGDSHRERFLPATVGLINPGIPSLIPPGPSFFFSIPKLPQRPISPTSSPKEPQSWSWTMTQIVILVSGYCSLNYGAEFPDPEKTISSIISSYHLPPVDMPYMIRDFSLVELGLDSKR